MHLTQRAIEGHYNTCIYIYTVYKRGGASGELPSKKSKTQRKRQYRCKVRCKSCGIQMNSDHFAKHNHTKHEGRAYSQKRSRRVSSRIDDHPETAATIQFQAYYRKWMCEVLDSLIREYRENMEQCLEKLKPLAEILQPPLTELTREHLESVSKLFLSSVSVDPEYLYAEFSVFENIVNSENMRTKAARPFMMVLMLHTGISQYCPLSTSVSSCC